MRGSYGRYIGYLSAYDQDEKPRKWFARVDCLDCTADWRADFRNWIRVEDSGRYLGEYNYNLRRYRNYVERNRSLNLFGLVIPRRLDMDKVERYSDGLRDSRNLYSRIIEAEYVLDNSCPIIDTLPKSAADMF